MQDSLRPTIPALPEVEEGSSREVGRKIKIIKESKRREREEKIKKKKKKEEEDKEHYASRSYVVSSTNNNNNIVECRHTIVSVVLMEGMMLHTQYV